MLLGNVLEPIILSGPKDLINLVFVLILQHYIDPLLGELEGHTTTFGTTANYSNLGKVIIS